MILDVGCGPVEKKENDTIYLDLIQFPNVDVVRDLDKGLPFDDEKFEEIKAFHVLEHVKDFIFVMSEFWRCLKKGGKLKIVVPSGQNAWIDSTHIRQFNEHSLDFFLIKDFNSVNAGVNGWFKLSEALYIGANEKEKKGRALKFLLEKM